VLTGLLSPADYIYHNHNILHNGIFSIFILVAKVDHAFPFSLGIARAAHGLLNWFSFKSTSVKSVETRLNNGVRASPR
jgi:hypothetical protein